jgi:transcription elongation factor GreA
MDNKKIYELTEEGKKKLEDELNEYIREGGLRDQNVEAIKEARAQGDLSENADYDAARDEQARIEARITELKEILKNVKIISADKSDKVTTGKTVVVKFIEKNRTNEYSLVGTIEADPFKNLISNESPLGKAIIGHSKGDEVTVLPENGKEFRVKILEVK